jgi:beta-1,4-N-acetylglucosaminyltransferase
MLVWSTEMCQNECLIVLLTCISGSGSILDALRTGVPVIVVPNETLLDNHQVELAEALAEQEYVVHGRLAQLPQALADAEKLRQRSLEWPPVNSGPQRGLKGIMDDEMGFLD